MEFGQRYVIECDNITGRDMSHPSRISLFLATDYKIIDKFVGEAVYTFRTDYRPNTPEFKYDTYYLIDHMPDYVREKCDFLNETYDMYVYEILKRTGNIHLNSRAYNFSLRRRY